MIIEKEFYKIMNIQGSFTFLSEWVARPTVHHVNRSFDASGERKSADCGEVFAAS